MVALGWRGSREGNEVLGKNPLQSCASGACCSRRDLAQPQFAPASRRRCRRSGCGSVMAVAFGTVLQVAGLTTSGRVRQVDDGERKRVEHFQVVDVGC